MCLLTPSHTCMCATHTLIPLSDLLPARGTSLSFIWSSGWWLHRLTSLSVGWIQAKIIPGKIQMIWKCHALKTLRKKSVWVWETACGAYRAENPERDGFRSPVLPMLTCPSAGTKLAFYSTSERKGLCMSLYVCVHGSTCMYICAYVCMWK